jgi:hypothetical protein
LKTVPSITPVKPPESGSDQAANNRFHPEMPKIPGVNDGSFMPAPAAPVSSPEGNKIALITGISASALLIVTAALWWIMSARNTTQTSGTANGTNEPSSLPVPASPEPTFTAPQKDGPTIAASAEQLSKPWSAKTFAFVKPITHEHVDAIVIRLPDGILWSFALKEPYGQCKLEFVTDLNRLASEFDFPAGHPMVVNPCNHTVYDPLKSGPAGGDVWVRGEIVRGIALRPPTSIEVQTKGRAIIATRME